MKSCLSWIYGKKENNVEHEGRYDPVERGKGNHKVECSNKNGNECDQSGSLTVYFRFVSYFWLSFYCIELCPLIIFNQRKGK